MVVVKVAFLELESVLADEEDKDAEPMDIERGKSESETGAAAGGLDVGTGAIIETAGASTFGEISGVGAARGGARLGRALGAIGLGVPVFILVNAPAGWVGGEMTGGATATTLC